MQHLPAQHSASTQKFVENGISVEFSAHPLDRTAANMPREKEDISFRFRVSEAESGAAITSRRLAAWIDPTGSTSASCQARVKGFLEGSFFYRPAADLNSYYVLTLNEDATISVMDPLVSYGGTHELTLVSLRSPGMDWADDPRHGRVFVSMPEAKKIAVVETGNWKVARELEMPGPPGRLILQPDRQYLWVAWESESAAGESGVVVFNAITFDIAARILTGKGAHDIALTDDSRVAMVTNRDSGDISLIDVQKLIEIRRERTGKHPVSIAYSSLSRMAYISNQEDGSITAIALRSAAKGTTIQADPGIGPIRFAPRGRFGFALNPSKNLVYIIDASTNSIIQTGDVEKVPDQIVFSGELAYIRHRNSETVLMIPLAAVGQRGQAVHLADFPAGQHGLGDGEHRSLADGIVQAPGENAVWVANSADRMIYYYEEGMAAPKGSLVTTQHPRALMVIDRSLRQTSPGVYETIGRLPLRGKYTVAMLLDNPQMIHCFDLAVEADPGQKTTPTRSVDVQLIDDRVKREAGAPTRVRLQFLDAVTRAPKNDLSDVRVLTYLPPGVWQDRLKAKSSGNGVYEIEFTPPQPGWYEVSVECPSQGVSYSTFPGWRLAVDEAKGIKQP